MTTLSITQRRKLLAGAIADKKKKVADLKRMMTSYGKPLSDEAKVQRQEEIYDLQAIIIMLQQDLDSL